MTQVSRGILAAVAISLSLGAVAWGRDLVATPQSPAGAPETAINRTAKTDRAATLPAPVQTRTIALRLDALADTSVLVRIPVAKAARNAPPGSMIKKPGDRSSQSPVSPSQRGERVASSCSPAAALPNNTAFAVVIAGLGPAIHPVRETRTSRTQGDAELDADSGESAGALLSGRPTLVSVGGAWLLDPRWSLSSGSPKARPSGGV
jgi:hypothetical protein